MDGYYSSPRGPWKGFDNHQELSTATQIWRAWKHDRQKPATAPDASPRVLLERRFMSLREARLMLERAVDALDHGWPELESPLRHAWESMGFELDRLRAEIRELPEDTPPAPPITHKPKVAAPISKGPAPFKVVDSRRFQEVAVSLGVARDAVSKDTVWQRFEQEQIKTAFGLAIRWT